MQMQQQQQRQQNFDTFASSVNGMEVDVNEHLNLTDSNCRLLAAAQMHNQHSQQTAGCATTLLQDDPSMNTMQSGCVFAELRSMRQLLHTVNHDAWESLWQCCC